MRSSTVAGRRSRAARRSSSIARRVGVAALQEAAVAAQDLVRRVAGDLQERLVDVDDRVVLEPRVGEDEAGAGQVERLAQERELAADADVLGLQAGEVVGEPDARVEPAGQLPHVRRAGLDALQRRDVADEDHDRVAARQRPARGERVVAAEADQVEPAGVRGRGARVSIS